MNLGDLFPNLEVDTTIGKLKLYDYFGEGWGVLFSHPAGFTPVCTTELGTVAKILPEFTKRNTKVIALSCDPVETNIAWITDIKSYSNTEEFNYPIISDANRNIAIQLGMLDLEDRDKPGMLVTCRAVFIVGPDRKLKLSTLYPASTGRNFDEILRVIDSLQLTFDKKLVTPANWTNGEGVFVHPSISKDDAGELFSDYRVKPLPSGKEYIRFTTVPK